jgi:hypothetical protein
MSQRKAAVLRKRNSISFDLIVNIFPITFRAGKLSADQSAFALPDTSEFVFNFKHAVTNIFNTIFFAKAV